jgi:orotidine-5'-phosphate decarboxylase
MGWRGTQLLEEISSYARKKGLLVLMDAKRGDIGSTAEAYAQSFLTKDAPVKSDALTVNPFLGLDTLEPYIQAAKVNGRGIFVLVKTSNPGSGDFQDMMVEEKALFERIAEKLKPHSQNFEAPRTGWSSLGIVVGATYPAQAESLRELLPRTPFLIPGYGAQGGGADDAVRTFVKGPNGYEGGIVNSSRAILFPDKGNTDNPKEWEMAVSDAIKHAVDDLTEALARK